MVCWQYESISYDISLVTTNLVHLSYVWLKNSYVQQGDSYVTSLKNNLIDPIIIKSCRLSKMK